MDEDEDDFPQTQRMDSPPQVDKMVILMQAELTVDKKKAIVNEIEKHLLPGREYTIGRLQSNDVIFKDASVSSKHAVIEVADNFDIFVQDMGSTNGTFFLKPLGKFEPNFRTYVPLTTLISFGEVVCKFRKIKDPHQNEEEELFEQTQTQPNIASELLEKLETRNKRDEVKKVMGTSLLRRKSSLENESFEQPKKKMKGVEESDQKQIGKSNPMFQKPAPKAVSKRKPDSFVVQEPIDLHESEEKWSKEREKEREKWKEKEREREKEEELPAEEERQKVKKDKNGLSGMSTKKMEKIERGAVGKKPGHKSEEEEKEEKEILEKNFKQRVCDEVKRIMEKKMKLSDHRYSDLLKKICRQIYPRCRNMELDMEVIRKVANENLQQM